MTETVPLTIHSARWKRLQPRQNMRRYRLSCSHACCVGTRVPVLLKEKMLPMFSPLHFIAYNSGKWSNLNVQWQLFFYSISTGYTLSKRLSVWISKGGIEDTGEEINWGHWKINLIWVDRKPWFLKCQMRSHIYIKINEVCEHLHSQKAHGCMGVGHTYGAW